ncbi:acyltransferase [Rhizobium sp. WL3]|uniref:acyltransferase n=1 Tax=Rhizobium sp. WL3 TaxID=2603277 RepID=UPI001FEE50BF|nr:acyltransferase [Rhizobium sp. WL3]
MAYFEGTPENIVLGKGAIIDAYARIYCHKHGRIVIGENTYIGPNAFIHTGKKNGHVTIGSNCTVQAFSMVHGHGGCDIGDDVRIAGHVVIIPANHRFEDPDRPIREQGLSKKGIRINSDVWIGAGALVLDGVTIGRGAVIGAGSVVNKDVASGVVAVGSPARPVAQRFDDNAGPATD